MTQIILDFETELYQEHLEEASFLYEQRLTLFDDPEIVAKSPALFSNPPICRYALMSDYVIFRVPEGRT